MDQRIERNVPPYPSKGERLSRWVGTVAYNAGGEVYGTVRDEEIAALESSGFDLEAVQATIDRLAHSRIVADQQDAAMLRGAFNDLLSRLPDDVPPKLDASAETEAA